MDFPTTFERHSTCPLIGQVERQDEYCDFTVEFGTWTKRFHRCVLAGSGFFETLFGQKEFIEHQKGSVHIHIGDKDTLEQALMFLYNKFPVLNMDNISLMLEMAEFLLIPTLKSYCVEWLNELTITRHIVWIILSLESLYDFQVYSTCQNLPRIVGR
ncbi:uncharacterized protein LOC128243202 [Mya arenaria]|uniref:uncharacterized protein LOC128243202 n=1 Tax=Mya arenaria TaxID=6604 RepID=UPI0022E66472|nr:uncharacterized protein LOC128243202 [Mya arenaria]